MWLTMSLFSGGHAFIFCSYVPFSECYNELSRIIENQEVADDNDLEITKVVEKGSFTVEKVPLKLIR